MHDLSFIEKSNLSWLKSNIISLSVVGSQSYGLATPESDYDFKGIVIPPKNYFIGQDRFEQATFEKPNPDCCLMNIQKWIGLALQCNPSIIELLWTDPEHFVITTPYWDRIVENRDKLLSKAVRWRFGGYAFSQLKKMKRHYRYLNNPPIEPPTREEFKLPKEYKLPKDQLDAALALIQKKLDSWNFNFSGLDEDDKLELKHQITDVMVEIVGASLYFQKEDLWKAAAILLGFEDNFIELIYKEKEYKQKKEDWKHYQKWKENRNNKRAELEKKVGYDSKDACSLIRLLKMAKEILTTGKVIVKRVDDREELLSIKRGECKYEDVLDYAEKANLELDSLYKTSILPNDPDRKFFNNLSAQIVEEYLWG